MHFSLGNSAYWPVFLSPHRPVNGPSSPLLNKKLSSGWCFSAPDSLLLRLQFKQQHDVYKYFFMKKGLHPANYRYVVFKDMSNGYSFLSRSTAASKETVQWEDGNEYPLIKLEISNTSHPFFTGKNMLVDTAGRIDKFKKKYAKK
jgi:large subunit ribosomal protein L31